MAWRWPFCPASGSVASVFAAHVHAGLSAYRSGLAAAVTVAALAVVICLTGLRQHSKPPVPTEPTAGFGTHLMMLVGNLRVISDGGTFREGLRGFVRPVTRLPLVLPTNRVAVFNSPGQRQNPHHQMCARARPQLPILPILPILQGY